MKKYFTMCVVALFAFFLGVALGYTKGRNDSERMWRWKLDATIRNRMCNEPGELYVCGQPEVWKYLPKQSER